MLSVDSGSRFSSPVCFVHCKNLCFMKIIIEHKSFGWVGDIFVRFCALLPFLSRSIAANKIGNIEFLSSNDGSNSHRSSIKTSTSALLVRTLVSSFINRKLSD